MRFTWPFALLSLVVVPVLLGIYVWQLKRKRRGAVRFSNVALIKAAMPRRPSWRRHIPVALFLAALGSLGVATARPQASMKVPIARTSIILAMDVSRSMCATDVEPNRLAVSQEAARAFVEAQPKGTRIGLVAFAGFAELVVAPTTDTAQLVAAINGFTTARGTVIGAAILKSIDAIAAVNPDVAPIGSDVMAGADLGFDATTGADVPTAEPEVPREEGSYVPDIVVLLTDGANTRGIEPLDASKEAIARGVRVYTIGFGTLNPTDMVCTPQQLGAGAFDENAFGGGAGGLGSLPPSARRQFLVIDEPTLRQVADDTGGEFYRAEDAGQLRQVFSDLPRDVELQERDVEISVAFAILGALLATGAMVLSLLWNRTP